MTDYPYRRIILDVPNSMKLSYATGVKEVSRTSMLAEESSKVSFEFLMNSEYIFESASCKGWKTGMSIPTFTVNSTIELSGMEYEHVDCDFIMPGEDVIITFKTIKGKRRIEKMASDVKCNEDAKVKDGSGVLCGVFEIPEELAKRLTELLTKQTIRERTLEKVADNIAKYETIEKSLIPIVNEIDAIKDKITKEFVPENYRSEKYVWEYNGYDIDSTFVSVKMA